MTFDDKDEGIVMREPVTFRPPQPRKKVECFATKTQVDHQINSAIEIVGQLVAETVEPLKKRVAELEASRFRFLGAWSEGLEAKPGNAVAHGGSTWICVERTTKKPGTADSGWVLACKKGADGKDAR
jgi:hypothetical protein